MNTIIIYGSKEDNEIQKQLIPFLKKDYEVTVIDFDKAYAVGEGEPISIISTNSLSEIKIPNAIIIFTQNAKLSNLKEIDKSCRLILNADDNNYIQRLSALNSNIYTCGFSSKDFITFSSREKDNVVVSLQRNIVLDNNVVCDPFEVPCEVLADLSDYTILSTILTLIFLNIFDEKKCSFLTKIYFL